MAYLYGLHTKSNRSLFVKDPYCPKDSNIEIGDINLIDENKSLVHIDYLCTWIGTPKN